MIVFINNKIDKLARLKIHHSYFRIQGNFQ